MNAFFSGSPDVKLKRFLFFRDSIHISFFKTEERRQKSVLFLIFFFNIFFQYFFSIFFFNIFFQYFFSIFFFNIFFSIFFLYLKKKNQFFFWW